MSKLTEDEIKISIKYTEGKDGWNNLVNFIISLMLDNDFLGGLTSNGEPHDN